MMLLASKTPRFAVLSALLSLSTLAWADSLKIDLDHEQKVSAQKTETAKVGPKAMAKEVKAESDKEGVIVGVTVKRGNGTFLGLSTENGGFKLAFYDVKKQPIAADVARANLRWNPRRTKGDEHVVLLPASDGKSLVFGKFVQPPRVFKVYVTLLSADDQAVESYVVDYREAGSEGAEE